MHRDNNNDSRVTFFSASIMTIIDYNQAIVDVNREKTAFSVVKRCAGNFNARHPPFKMVHTGQFDPEI